MGMPLIKPSSDGAGLLAVGVITTFLATLAMALRIWARKLVHLTLGLDDYLALATLIVHYGGLVVYCLWILYGGIGTDMMTVLAQSPTAVTWGFEIMFYGQFLYGFASPAIKLSLLAFYWKIFPTRTVRYGVYFLSFCCISWFIGIMVTNLVSCRPISFFWTQSGDGVCVVDTISYFKWNSFANSVIDLLTVCLPIREVARLQMSTARKISIICVFLVGSLVVIASTIRFASLVILANAADPASNTTKRYTLMTGASMAEINIAIIGACSVTLGPVYRRLRYGDPQGSSASKRQGKSGESWSNGIRTVGKISVRGRSSFEQLSGLDGLDAGSETRIMPGPQQNAYPMKGINVERGMTWTETHGSTV